MAHFARLDENNVVQEVIVIANPVLQDENGQESEALGIAFCNTLKPGIWVQTSYNGNFRKRYAGQGMIYRQDLDAFISPQPFLSWTLNSTTTNWEPPVPYPTDDKPYYWDEDTLSWILGYVPKPFPSWLMNEVYNWEAPVLYPGDGKDYRWEESLLNWVEIV